MATIGTMVLKFTADIGGLTKGIEEAQSQLQSVGNAMRGWAAAAMMPARMRRARRAGGVA